MKHLLGVMLMFVASLVLAEEPRRFHVEVREITEQGDRVFASQDFFVVCDTSVPVRVMQETKYPTNPPMTGQKMEFKGEFLLSQCAEAK